MNNTAALAFLRENLMTWPAAGEDAPTPAGWEWGLVLGVHQSTAILVREGRENCLQFEESDYISLAEWREILGKDAAIAFLRKHLLTWPSNHAGVRQVANHAPIGWGWGAHCKDIEAPVLIKTQDYQYLEDDTDKFITRDEWSFKEKLYMVCDRSPAMGRLGIGRLLRENGELVGRHASSSLSFLREDLRAKVNSQFEITDLIGHPVPERFRVDLKDWPQPKPVNVKREAVREIMAAAVDDGRGYWDWLETNVDTFFNEG